MPAFSQTNVRFSQTNVRLLTLACALFANAFAMSNPFPYGAFLVLHYGLTDDTRSAGFFAGYIVSAFMVGRLLSSYPLGAISDTWGRRPVIEIGLLSCIGFQLLFALSPSFGLALSSRLLMGFFNGIIGVSKAWLPELVPHERQPFAMSLVSGMWGVGQVIGPACGGLLYHQPSARPDVAGESTVANGADLLVSFPHLLPNLVGCLVGGVALVAVRWYLPRGGGESGAHPCSNGCLSRMGRRLPSRRGRTEGITLVSDDGAKAVASADSGPSAGADAQAASARAGALGTQGGTPGCGVPRTSVAPLLIYCMLSGFSICTNEAYPLWLVAPVASGGLGWSASRVGSLQACGGLFLALANFVLFPLAAKRIPPTSMFKGCCALLALLTTSTALIASVAASAPSLLVPLLLLHSALSQMCSSTCFTSVFLLINNSCTRAQRGACAPISPSPRPSTIPPRAARRPNQLGPPPRHRAAPACPSPLNSPCALARPRECGCRDCDGHRACRGRTPGKVNGLGMSLSSAFKAAGPTVGAVSFAWSLTNGLPFPFNVHFTFIFSGILAAITAAVAFLWLTPLNDKPLPPAAGGAQATTTEEDMRVHATPAAVELVSSRQDRDS
jgi:MFS family permease